MKKITTLRELQLVTIFVYKDLMNFCEKNDIKVYLHGGSLIGAVRHKGYIPWDDDIDVCISRKDYDKLLKISQGRISEHCSIIDPYTDDTFNGYIPLVVYNDSLLNSKQYRTNETLKVGVSIFVYDGITSNKFLQKFYYARMYGLRALHALCRADFHHVNTKTAKVFGKLLQGFFNASHTKKYKRKILDVQKKYHYEKSDFVSTNADFQSSKQVCSRVSFEKSVPLLFEGISSYTYSHYDDHLKKYYGDYMKLPPLEEQKPKHGFDAWVDDNFQFIEL